MTSDIKKLYDVPRDSYIKLAPIYNVDLEEKVFHFHHVDGMYSFCEDISGYIIHLPAYADVIIVSKEDFNKQKITYK